MSSLENANDQQIWFFSHSYLPARGGIENYIREAGRQLLKRGYRVGVICRRFEMGLSEEEVIEGIRVIRHPDFTVPRHLLLFKHRYLAGMIARWLEDTALLREGIAVCRYPLYGYALSLLSEHHPSLYIPASIWADLAARMITPNRIKERLFARLWKRQMILMEKTALEEADRVVAFSRNISDQLREAYRIDRERIVINPPGVDGERFSPSPPSPELIKELNLNAATPIILSVGRLSPEKNLPFLLEALAPLLKSGNITLLLVGDGPMKKKLKEDILRSGLEGYVRLTGMVQRPEEYYSLARIFVSVSRYESFGQTLLEAMASGIPVVALQDDRVAVRVAAGEIVRDGESGYLVPENPSSLRAKIERLLTDEELRRKFGVRGREICRERFSWDRHVDELLNVMNNFIEYSAYGANVKNEDVGIKRR